LVIGSLVSKYTVIKIRIIMIIKNYLNYLYNIITVLKDIIKIYIIYIQPIKYFFVNIFGSKWVNNNLSFKSKQSTVVKILSFPFYSYY